MTSRGKAEIRKAESSRGKAEIEKAESRNPKPRGGHCAPAYFCFLLSQFLLFPFTFHVSRFSLSGSGEG